MMQASERLQLLTADSFFATITRMALQGKLSLCQPAVQRFGINAQVSARLGNREKKSWDNSFRMRGDTPNA